MDPRLNSAYPLRTSCHKGSPDYGYNGCYSFSEEGVVSESLGPKCEVYILDSLPEGSLGEHCTRGPVSHLGKEV